MLRDTTYRSTGRSSPRHDSCVTKSHGPKITDEGRTSAERIKWAMRHARGGALNQTGLAEATGLPYSRLGHYVQGTHRLPIREAKLIEHATGIPAAYLMGLVDDLDRDLLMVPKDKRALLLEFARSYTASPPAAALAAPAREIPFPSTRPARTRRPRGS